MIYTTFQDKKLPMLGLGCMRLPKLENGAIDQPHVEKMVQYAMEHGVNYFDTAYPYHASTSELSIGRALARYPRESWFLADKYPGHQIASVYDPAAVFEQQLKKCGVEYFDFYLLHNLNEDSIRIYLDPRWNIIPYFREQKKSGRIRHLGFSCHCTTALLRQFLDVCGEDMEFCQIQLNWLDWTLQDAKGKVALLNERSIPIWVMEPVRGGRLCSLSEQDEATLRALRPQDSIPAWSFRFLQEIPGVTMILSGMSNLSQLEENTSFFDQRCALSEEETAALFAIAESMKSSVPCTACRYCTDHCPKGLDIPVLLEMYNELRFAPDVSISIRLAGFPEDKLPEACIGCGQCAKMCPQQIDIPAVLKSLSESRATLPDWKAISRAREEEAKRAEV